MSEIDWKHEGERFEREVYGLVVSRCIWLPGQTKCAVSFSACFPGVS